MADCIDLSKPYNVFNKIQQGSTNRYKTVSKIIDIGNGHAILLSKFIQRSFEYKIVARLIMATLSNSTI